MHPVRQSAVAGAFYPAQPAVLVHTLAVLLDQAKRATPLPTRTPKALIVPHAGYVYSGATAALAYAQLTPARDLIRRVVLLGPAHRVAVRGLALAGADTFATPLGDIPIDTDAVEVLRPLGQVVLSPAAHAMEHSLEVQLPFLQTVLSHFTLVPLVVGDATPGEVAEVLELLWGGPETLIVISSDLSHFLTYRGAQEIDRETAQTILALDSSLSSTQACGGRPINGLLLAAQRHGLRPRLLGLCNSGDATGDQSRVVGYGAFAFEEPIGHGH